MEEILERLGINTQQSIYSIMEELENKQLDVLAKLDVIQSRAGESKQNEELEKKLLEDMNDIDECLQLVRWAIKKSSVGLSKEKTKAGKEATTQKGSDAPSFNEKSSSAKEEDPSLQELFKKGKGF